MKRLIGFIIVVFLGGCHPRISDKEDSTQSTEEMELFGSPLTNTERMSFGQLEEKLALTDTVSARISGVVTEVCQMKGCWMTITSGEEGGRQFMVRFKDYGFFVPKDISGTEVVIEGKAFTEKTSVEELRHYALDAGLSQEEIDKIKEPQLNYVFMANGVELYKENK